MKKKWIGILILILCAAAAGWISYTWYDANTDRSGWQISDAGTFYTDFHGKRVAGWQEIDGQRYYFNEVHEPRYAMATGWMDLDGKRFYLGEDGILVTGWQEINGQAFCFGKDGSMVTGWATRDGVPCYLGSDGTIATGWLEDSGTRYYLNENGVPVSGWQEINGTTYYFQENGVMLTGWALFEGLRYYFLDDGAMAAGWTDIEGSRYYFTEDGSMHTGWLELGEYRYYLHEDGTTASGPTEIDGVTCYFSPHGVHILLVNPWNYLPEGYAPDLLNVPDSYYRIDSSCYDAFMQMMDDCRAAGYAPRLSSAYRTQADQVYLFQRKTNIYLDQGYSDNDARQKAAKSIAVPGTSEHQLGLAVDIIDSSYTAMDDAQANTATQQWLMAHCAEYGFILRYPSGTTDITGIIYEPWHYRYVGVEIAHEIQDLGITLEEYLGATEHK